MKEQKKLIMGPSDFKHIATVGKFDIFKANGPTTGIQDMVNTIYPQSREKGFERTELTREKYQELYKNNYAWYNDFLQIFDAVYEYKPKTARILAISINYDFFRNEEMYIFQVKTKTSGFPNTYIGLWDVKYKTVL